MHSGRRLASLLALAVALLPAAVRAQASYALAEVVVHGRIAAFTPHLGILVRDERGYFDRVVLKRHGTIINPRGKRLSLGMAVTIRGLNQGTTLLALQIDVNPRGLAARSRAAESAGPDTADLVRLGQATNRLRATRG